MTCPRFCVALFLSSVCVDDGADANLTPIDWLLGGVLPLVYRSLLFCWQATNKDYKVGVYLSLALANSPVILFRLAKLKRTSN